MPENRKQLISKLKSLNPNINWCIDDNGYMKINDVTVGDLDGVEPDDRILITLAPSMREELLKMEEEMEKMRQLLERAETLVGNPATNISSSIDLACESWHNDYNQLNQPQP